MSRWARRIDENQPRIVEALRAADCTVCLSYTWGQGAPDLIVLHRPSRRVSFLEVKNPKQPPSARRLTAVQAEFHEAWQGVIHIVTSPEEAVRIATGGNAAP